MPPSDSFLFLQCVYPPLQVHGALFRADELGALVAALERDGELREKDDARIALKRQQFEDSMVRGHFSFGANKKLVVE